MVYLSFQKVLCSLLELQVQVPAGKAVCLPSLTHLPWVAHKQASPAGPGPDFFFPTSSHKALLPGFVGCLISEGSPFLLFGQSDYKGAHKPATLPHLSQNLMADRDSEQESSRMGIQNRAKAKPPTQSCIPQCLPLQALDKEEPNSL